MTTGEQKPKVTVYVMSHERPAFVAETIDSILSQTYKNFEIIVSDNSEHDEVERLVRTRYPAVRCVRRKPSLPALDHFRAVLSEIDAEYFV